MTTHCSWQQGTQELLASAQRVARRASGRAGRKGGHHVQPAAQAGSSAAGRGRTGLPGPALAAAAPAWHAAGSALAAGAACPAGPAAGGGPKGPAVQAACAVAEACRLAQAACAARGSRAAVEGRPSAHGAAAGRNRAAAAAACPPGAPQTCLAAAWGWARVAEAAHAWAGRRHRGCTAAVGRQAGQGGATMGRSRGVGAGHSPAVGRSLEEGACRTALTAGPLRSHLPAAAAAVASLQGTQAAAAGRGGTAAVAAGPGARAELGVPAAGLRLRRRLQAAGPLAPGQSGRAAQEGRQGRRGQGALATGNRACSQQQGRRELSIHKCRRSHALELPAEEST